MRPAANPEHFALLLEQARGILAESTSESAAVFDVDAWLQAWIDRPQPALGGRRPLEVMQSPEGLKAVLRLMGASVSGAYQ